MYLVMLCKDTNAKFSTSGSLLIIWNLNFLFFMIIKHPLIPRSRYKLILELHIKKIHFQIIKIFHIVPRFCDCCKSPCLQSARSYDWIVMVGFPFCRLYCCIKDIKKAHQNKLMSFKKTGGDLLSRFRSTIGARGLNFCVRNGNRWAPLLKPP